MALTYGCGGSFTVAMAGPFAAAGSPVRLRELTLSADGWKGGESPYFQVVPMADITAASKVDLLPSYDQLQQLRSLELALTTENDLGTVTVYAIGRKPHFDLTLQAVITEVTT